MSVSHPDRYSRDPWPFPSPLTQPGYFDAVRDHNAALAALARDCTACAADYAEVDRAFSEALRALPSVVSL